MNFRKDTKFFFTDYHKGSVNILLHVVSLVVLVIGLLNENLILSILGLAIIDELGHIYNYYITHKRDPIYNPIRMFPYQILYVGPVALIIFKIFRLI